MSAFPVSNEPAIIQTMTSPVRPLIQRAVDISGLPRAFRPNPLIAEEMEFYAESLNKRRANYLQRRIRDDLLEAKGQAFFFRLYSRIYG